MSARPPLALLPGLGCDERLWAAQLRFLRPLCPQVAVGDVGAAGDVRGAAAAVLSRAPRRFALAGLSLGGIVALEIWRQAPERVAGIALLDTTTDADTEDKRRLREARLERMREVGLARMAKEELAPTYFAPSRSQDSALGQLVADMAEAVGEADFVRQCAILASRPDSAATLAGIRVPALALCGAQDALCPPAIHERMAAAIDGAELRVLDDCGHLSTLEQPTSVNQALLEWLNRCAEADQGIPDELRRQDEA